MSSSMITFEFDNVCDSYTENQLVTLLMQTMRSNLVGTSTEKILFLGGSYSTPQLYDDVTKLSIPLDLKLGENIWVALQLRGQHKIVLGESKLFVYDFVANTVSLLDLDVSDGARSMIQLLDGRVAIGLLGSVLFFDPITFKQVAEIKFEKHSYNRHSVLEQLSHEELACTNEFIIEIWNLTTMKRVRVFEERHTSSITSIKLLSNGKLASSSFDRTICIWDKEQGTCIKTLEGHTDNIWSIIEYKGMLASCGYDRTIRLWSLEDYLHLKIMIDDASCLYSLLQFGDRLIAVGNTPFAFSKQNGVQVINATAVNNYCAVPIVEYGNTCWSRNVHLTEAPEITKLYKTQGKWCSIS